MNVRISVREARANLSAHLKSENAIAIGDRYKLRGFIIGVPQHNNWSYDEKKKALREALGKVKAAIEAEMP